MVTCQTITSSHQVQQYIETDEPSTEVRRSERIIYVCAGNQGGFRERALDPQLLGRNRGQNLTKKKSRLHRLNSFVGDGTNVERNELGREDATSPKQNRSKGPNVPGDLEAMIKGTGQNFKP